MAVGFGVSKLAESETWQGSRVCCLARVLGVRVEVSALHPKP